MTFNVLISNVDDHLRNHGFLWTGSDGWTLSPAYDLNPVPADVRARILTTRINLTEGTCDLDLVLEVAEYFGLNSVAAMSIVSEVAAATSRWKEVAIARGARPAEIKRMSSAFDHDDLAKALRLS
jgi:serine/threonine-protein kinase HipA